MRSIVLLLSILTPVLVFGDTSAQSREAILKIERELAEATRVGDAAVWDRHMAPTFIFTNPAGEVHDPKEATQGLRSGALKFSSIDVGQVRIVFYGDTAVVSFDSKQEVAPGSPAYGGHFQWTDTFVKQNGRWLIVARHGSARR